jgi:Carboxypeptidase regulatory-like domain
MLSKRVVLVVVALCCLLALTPSALYSQSTSAGSVAGLVTDASGGSVVGATITLTDRATNSPRTATSNASGRYNFADVTPGDYEITANKTGFRVAKISHIQVTVGTTFTVDVKLEIGSVAEIVEVTTTGAELQTTNATMGTTLSGETLLLLPNLGRDVTELLIAQPGVSPDGYSAGANYDQNMYQLDGGNNSNDMDGSMSIYTPGNGSTSPQSTGGNPSGVLPTPVESVEEFKVSTSNQAADFNGAGGAQVQLITKRGTSQWHGEASEYYLGSNFGANTWDNDVAGRPKVSTHQNRFGGAVGGPILPKEVLGGKTYFFANYEGIRYPLSSTFERQVPSDLFRSGILQIKDATGVWEKWNLNPANGPTAMCGPAMNQPCDPRGLWFNPTIQNLWSKYMPEPNDLGFGDAHNTQGFKGTVLTPVKADFGVARLDHDFGKNWHFMSSYRMYKFSRLPTVQTDIGGFFPGDKLGQIAVTASRPQKPWYLVAGLTTNITPNLTNDFHYSYLRNFWSWQTQLAPPQVPGIPGAIEIAPGSGSSESANALIPYNVNTQSVRIRFWDGHDSYYRDDLSYLHGDHLWQIGGLVQHNWDFHTRDDNGSGTFVNPVFLVGAGESGVSIGSAFRPQTCDPTNNITTNCIIATQVGKWKGFYADALGITGAQVAYTRAGSNLSLQPLGTNAFDKSTINTYNLYFTDTWHLKPSFTVNYGLGWLLETPPHEQDGKQITLVDQSGSQVGFEDYMSTRQRAALAGQVYNPVLGYSLVGNVGKGLKYPYRMFWGGFSPRVSAAWNPRFDSGLMEKLFGHSKTVLRGGYGRVYGRQNGVDLVLVPLLGVGLIQAVKCPGASMAGACLGTGGTTPATAFRIGTDPNPGNLYQQGISQTLCQPFFPGLTNCDGNTAAKASDTLVLDPHYKPAHSDEFNFTIQRDLGHNMTLEVGYLGRILRDEFTNANLDQIPWMLKLNGQTFAQAYGDLYKSYCGLQTVCAGNTTAAVEPFFEAALGGASSAYCSPFAATNPAGPCTAAVIANEGNNGTGNFSSQSLYQMWSSIGKAAGCKGVTACSFNNSLIGQQQASSVQMSGAFGRGNYNAAIVSLTARQYKGLTINTNFTWSRSMGTQFYAQANNGINPNNGYDLKNFGSYGVQPYDVRFVYNLQALYQLPFYKNQHGFIGRALGGWSVAPFFTAKSGYPILVFTDGNISDETWGQGNPNSGNLGTNAVLLSPYNGGSSLHGNVPGSNGIGTNGIGLNLFKDPSAVYNQFRPFILGLDGPNGGGGGPLRGMSHWNLNLTVSKEIKFTERLNARFIAQFSNLMNHPWFVDPYLDLQDPADFGSIYNAINFNTGNIQINEPRKIEFGLRFGF